MSYVSDEPCDTIIKAKERQESEMNRTSTHEIPVVFISDERYAMPTGVAITSLRLNAAMPEGVCYEVFVVSLDMSEDSRKRLQSLSTDRFHVTIIDYALSERQRSVHSNNGSHVSTAAIVKFELANLLPQYDKLLYLDSDLLVLKGILGLWNTDITEHYAAAVIDGASKNKDFQEHVAGLGLDPKQYFNSGVLLLNAQKLREDGVCGKLLDYRIHGKNFYMDQDALNVIFSGKVKYLSPYYNVFNSWYRSEKAIQAMSVLHQVDFDLRPERVYFDAVILHFGDWRKPWNMNEGQLTGLFYSYYMLSPFEDRKDLRIHFALTWTYPIYKKKMRVYGQSFRYKLLKYTGLLWLRKKLRRIKH